ncbi:MAG TPA: DUF2007 domain-containing protein [Anaerolineales bacterium]|jgi:hypothetical protein|nr:DUF2007 domain-containing protein [Anaerolineales bacterium]
MTANELEKLTTLNNPTDAELLRGLLEAQGIKVMLSKEGAAIAYGLTVGAFAEIELFVPHSQIGKARDILNEYFPTRAAKPKED